MGTTARWTVTAAIAAALLVSACNKGGGKGGGGGGSGGASDTPDTSGGDGCGTCAQVFVNGGVPCDGTKSNDAYIALIHCACDACISGCSDTICSDLPSNGMCGDCLSMSCQAETQACADN
jgi:hypothetical protein